MEGERTTLFTEADGGDGDVEEWRRVDGGGDGALSALGRSA